MITSLIAKRSIRGANIGLRAAPAALSTPLVERAVLAFCLTAIGFHFYPMAGRFLDQDELYFFHVSHAVSQGVPLYSGLDPYYPPLLFYIGAVFFTLFHDLYLSLLAARILGITCGLIGFFFVFDIFRRLRLTYFIVPVAFVIPFLTQFDLKLTEFRADNFICPMIAAQAWLVFRVNEGTARLDRTLLAVVFVGLVAVHLSQKAVPIEGALLIVLLTTQLSGVRGLVHRHSPAVSLGALVFTGVVAWSAGYRLFVQRTYVDTLRMMSIYPPEEGARFLLTCLQRNLGFWLLAVLSTFVIAEGLPAHPRRNLLPLMLLAGACVLVYASSFPYLHYQLYLAWAALLALPFAVAVARDLFPGGMVAAFALCSIAALSSLRTFQTFEFPHQPLREYASMVERAQHEIGPEAVGFVGGTLISSSSIWPQDPINGYKYYRDYVVERRWRMSRLLRQTGAKLVFDPRALVREQAVKTDRVFIGLNYRDTPGLPLLIASRWYWFDAGQSSLAVEMSGPYRTWVFGDGAGTTSIDGVNAGGGATLQLDAGTHRVEATAPGVMLAEFASPTVRSSESQDIGTAKRTAFAPVDADFSGDFRLLGVLRLEEDDADVFHVFWQKTANVEEELLAFHHFRDGGGNFIHGENVDPGAGWYSLRDLGSGQVFSYRFRVAKGLNARSLDIGLYHRNDIARRIPRGHETYFRVDLASL